jgi:hypothetical protein
MTFQEVIDHLKSRMRYIGERHIQIVDDESFKHIYLHTEEHRYAITFRETTIEKRGYLGCIARCRRQKVGEDWTRGNDLADGPDTIETLDSILFDIAGYEISGAGPIPPAREPGLAAVGIPDDTVTS